MSPWIFLITVLLISAGALGWSMGRVLRVERDRMALAGRWSMQFSAVDRFGLAERLAGHLSCPGAAAIRAFNVIYCLRDECHYYICTVEYTRGVIRTKWRRRVVARVTEPRVRETADQVEVVLAQARGARGYQELLPGDQQG